MSLETEVKENVAFRTILSVYTSKNNIIFVVTDVLGQVLYRISGGQATRRGTEKNMTKCLIRNLEYVATVLADLGTDHLEIRIKKAFGKKGHGPTTKGAVKMLSTYAWPPRIQGVLVTNSTSRLEGVPPKQYGSRGRKV